MRTCRRCWLAQMSVEHPDRIDAKLNRDDKSFKVRNCSSAQLAALGRLGVFGRMGTVEEMLAHKYLLSVEGYGGNDFRVHTIQGSRSLLLRLAPVCVDWLQEQERAMEHFVEVRKDL